MKPLSYCPTISMSLGLLLARVPVGLFFLLAGIGKIRGGVENFVEHAMARWLNRGDNFESDQGDTYHTR